MGASPEPIRNVYYKTQLELLKPQPILVSPRPRRGMWWPNESDLDVTLNHIGNPLWMTRLLTRLQHAQSRRSIAICTSEYFVGYKSIRWRFSDEISEATP